MEKSLWSAHPAMIQVLHDPKYYEIQILYTHIERNDQGEPTLESYDFRVNDSLYFYPASTVKFPVAVLALEYLDSLNLDNKTPYRIEGDSLLHSVADDVRQIFAVSDNEAYNRLYELLGRDYVNNRMATLGISSFRLAHRLSVENASKAERKKLTFFSEDTLILGGGADSPNLFLPLKKTAKGIGYIKDSIMVREPMDFSKKNYFPLKAQHELMKRLFFQKIYLPNQRLALSEESHSLLRKTMAEVPRRQGYEVNEFYDSYGKFFLFGDSKEPIPPNFKIYNKVGYAYGTLSETAYIVDSEYGIEFLLSATLLVNKNGIFNDDQYEYESLGIPFMAQLGRELYLREREMRQK